MDVHEYFNTLNRDGNYPVQIASNESSVGKEDTTSQNSFDLMAIGAIAFVSILVLIWRSHFKKASGNLPKLFNSSTQTNCTKCRFYDENSYLKCAVQPTKVLKQEAQECSDYEAIKFGEVKED